MINCCKTLAILVVLWYNSIVNEWYAFTTNTSTKGQQTMKNKTANTSNYNTIDLDNIVVGVNRQVAKLNRISLLDTTLRADIMLTKAENIIDRAIIVKSIVDAYAEIVQQSFDYDMIDVLKHENLNGKDTYSIFSNDILIVNIEIYRIAE